MRSLLRPIALVLITLLSGLGLSACRAVPDTFACAHCTCFSAPRSASRPVSCSAIGRDDSCCVFLGS